MRGDLRRGPLPLHHRGVASRGLRGGSVPARARNVSHWACRIVSHVFCSMTRTATSVERISSMRSQMRPSPASIRCQWLDHQTCSPARVPAMGVPSAAALRPLERSRRLYEDVGERLGEFVRESSMRPGDQFPPERELAQRLHVSRTSVRQSFVVLQALGFVDVRHGEGVFLRRTRGFGESLAKLLERRRRLPDVLEAREALEVKLAALAAFHHAIALAARNQVLLHLIDAMAEVIQESRVESLSEPGRPPRSLEAHGRILSAIESGNAQLAADAMRQHLRVVADVSLLRWQPEASDDVSAGA